MALGSAPTATVTDFFPMKPGASYVYEENYNGLIDKIVDTFGTQGSMGRFNDVIAITTKIPNLPNQFTYYRIQGNDVQLVAFVDSRPLDKPMPVISFTGKKTDWTWKGAVDYGRGDWKVTLKGKAVLGKNQSVFGADRQMLQVDLTMQIEMSPQEIINLQRQDIYASGLGLFSTNEKTELNEVKASRTRKLLSFDLSGDPK